MNQDDFDKECNQKFDALFEKLKELSANSNHADLLLYMVTNFPVFYRPKQASAFLLRFTELFTINMFTETWEEDSIFNPIDCTILLLSELYLNRLKYFIFGTKANPKIKEIVLGVIGSEFNEKPVKFERKITHKRKKGLR